MLTCEACGRKRDAQMARIIAQEVDSKAMEASELYTAGSIPFCLKTNMLVDFFLDVQITFWSLNMLKLYLCSQCYPFLVRG